MRKVAINIDGDITLAECMRMAASIGCTLRGSPSGELLITRQTDTRKTGAIVSRTHSNVIPFERVQYSYEGAPSCEH